jgi:spore germination protein (amino acid permease)
MTDSYKYKLTSKNFAFLLIATMTEVTFLRLAKNSSIYAGHDAWISILLSSSLAFAAFFIINKLCSRFPSLTLAELNDKILGRFLGKTLSFIYVLYFMTYSALVVRLFVELLNTYLFVRTPAWALSLLMVLTVTYIFSRDIRPIAWMNELIQYAFQLLWIMVLFGLSEANLNNLLPVGDAGLINILLGSQGAFFAYLGPEMLLVVYPFIQNKKEIFKAGFIAIMYNTLSYTIVAVVVILAFGENVLQLLVWDFLALVKTYRLPLVERGEFILVVFWSLVAFRSPANYLYMAKHTLAKAAGISEHYHNYIYVTLAVAVLVLSRVPTNTAQALLFTNPMGTIGIFLMMLGLPTALLLISLIRGIKE